METNKINIPVSANQIIEWALMLPKEERRMLKTALNVDEEVEFTITAKQLEILNERSKTPEAEYLTLKQHREHFKDKF